MKILSVVGARPNFMKIAPIVAEIGRRPNLRGVLAHTGQHYDETMSAAFFRDLEIPAPDHHLGVGSGTHAEQTARVMLAFEPVVTAERPDWVIVVGDVNSTLACALVAVKLGVRVAHVEAGLRSFDRCMPEEINRVATDAIADLLLTPSADADANLRREGVPEEKIRRVGNVMIDTLRRQLPFAARSPILETFGLAPRRYAVVTLHRPSNVDDEPTLRGVLSSLAKLAQTLPVVFPVHPRTRQKLASLRDLETPPGLRLCEPLGYRDFLRLWSAARLVLTDSGGLQEETTGLGVPCLTLRENTERPITVSEGTNRVVGVNPANIDAAIAETLAAPPVGRIPELWDGRTAERIVGALCGDGA